MPRQFRFEGKTYSLPDDTTDQEAVDFISGHHQSLPFEQRTPQQQQKATQTARHSLTGREAPTPSLPAQAANLMEGTAKYASGAAIPAAVMSPVATGAAALGGMGGYGMGTAGAALMGAGPDGQRLAGDIGALPGAMVGEGAVNAMRPYANALTDPKVLRMGVKALPKGADALNFFDTFNGAVNRNRPPSPLPPPPPTAGPTAPSSRPDVRFTPGQYDAPPPPKPAVETGGSSIPDYTHPLPGPEEMAAKIKAGKKAEINSAPAAPVAPIAPSAPPLASPAEQSGQVVRPGEIPVRQHETNQKVDQQITNKVNNLAEYLRSKGGTPEHLDRIVSDPGLTRQYLNEAHSYGKAKGNPVPKTGYKGLDPGSDTHTQVRQRLLDMIEEAKKAQ